MSTHNGEKCPQRRLENIAIFGGQFTVSQVAEHIGDTIHNPHVSDVPQGAVITLGVISATIVTATVDHFLHRSK